MSHCTQCGNEISQNDKFCTNCGAASNPVETPPRKKGAGKLLKIGLPVFLAVIIAIAAIILIVVRTNPLVVTGRALLGFGAEVTQRIDGTPLKAAGMLTNILEDGEVTVNTAFENNLLGNIAATVRLLSNNENREYAILAQTTVLSRTIEAEAFINKERIALGSTLFGDTYYGIIFKTFREDIRVFGGLIGLDSQTMNMLADTVEMIESILHTPGVEDGVFEPYIRLMADFILSLDTTSEKTRIESGGVSVRVRKIGFAITHSDIAELLHDLTERMSEDENLRQQFELIFESLRGSNMLGHILVPSYDAALHQLRQVAGELERNIEGEITITFYIDSENRLLKIETDADMIFYGQRIRTESILDLGTSAQDLWVLTGTTDTEGLKETFEIMWGTLSEAADDEGSRLIHNTISITDTDGYSATLSSHWNEESGSFTLAYESDRSRDGGELTGVFKVRGQGFTLGLDNLLSQNEALSLEITASPGAQIRDIEFINIDRWGANLIRDLQRALISFLLGR